MEDFFLRVVQIIPEFDLTNPEILPYGLKPHTRSVSWIVEQVITQQAKYNRRLLGVQDVDIDMPDTCLHDCVVTDNENNKYYINVKITDEEKSQAKTILRQSKSCTCNTRRMPIIA